MKACFSPDGVFLEGDKNICAKFALFSTDFVHDCRINPSTRNTNSGKVANFVS